MPIKRWFAFLISALFVANSYAEPRVLLIYDNGVDRFRVEIHIGVGAGTQRFNPRFDFTSAAWLVVPDSECGRSLLGTAKCPRYCQEGYFRATFCSPLCRRINSVEQKIFCGSDFGIALPGFNATKSATFRPVNKTAKWSNAEIQPRHMYGEFGSDVLRMRQSVFNNHLIELGRLEFVRGRLLNRGYLGREDAFFGLLPSSDNLVVQLYRQAQIPRAQILFFRSQDLSILRPYSIQIGALERNGSCTNMTLHTPAFPRTWVLRAKYAAISGFEHKGESLVVFDPNVNGLRAPAELIERLIANHILIEPAADEILMCGDEPMNYFYSRPGYLLLQLGIDELDLQFGPEVLVNILWHNDTHGCTRIERGYRKMAERRPYTDMANWALGHVFIKEALCLGLDYERGLVALADMKPFVSGK